MLLPRYLYTAKIATIFETTKFVAHNFYKKNKATTLPFNGMRGRLITLVTRGGRAVVSLLIIRLCLRYRAHSRFCACRGAPFRREPGRGIYAGRIRRVFR